MKQFLPRAAALLALGFAFFRPLSAEGEAMLQYFNTDWNEIALKMPELAEAGYDSLWLPPPTKGSGGLSVGYDLWDRFDLGSKDQRGSVRTRYGTEAELLRMIEVAHRFGIRVYLDNIMNHNAFDVPGFNAQTAIDIYPGFGPNNGITKEMLAQNAGFYSEQVEDMLNRSARWLIDRTKADGLRLDAVKHVRYDFFGASFGADKDSSDYGYTGQVQRQFNI